MPGLFECKKCGLRAWNRKPSTGGEPLTDQILFGGTICPGCLTDLKTGAVGDDSVTPDREALHREYSSASAERKKDIRRLFNAFKWDSPTRPLRSPSHPSSPEAKNNATGCFIATACYGSYEHPQVIILRSFRDEQLLTCSLGKRFVRLYYRYSPIIATRLDSSGTTAMIVKTLILKPLIFLIGLKQ